jgi:hypothetical protein
MSEPTQQDISLAVMVGEMRGQLREVVHSVKDVSGKIDGLAREVMALGPLGREIAELRADIVLAKTEIDALKSDRDQRKGAVGLIEWSIRHWPGVAGFILLVGILLRSEGKL